MERMDFTDEISALLQSEGLSGNDREVIKKYLSETTPRILIKPQVKVDFNNRSISHFGGLPSLPTEEHWPVDENGSAGIFLCQIDCKEVHKVVPEIFPKSGLLFFFTWGNVIEGWDKASEYPTVLYLDIPSETPALDSLPQNYNGGDMFSAQWFSTAHCRDNGSRENLSEAILPRVDIEFIYQDDFQCIDKFMGRYEVSDSVENFLTFLDGEVSCVLEKTLNPGDKDRTNSRFLNPGTIRTYQFGPKRDTKWIDNAGYPWCGMSITRFMQEILERTQRDASQEARSLEILWEHFDCLYEYGQSYNSKNFGVSNTFSPILLGSTQLESMERWIVDNNAGLLEHFYALKCLELINLDAAEWIKAFEGQPFEEPKPEEKDRFNHWVSGWINAVVLEQAKRSDYARKRIAPDQKEEIHPVRELSKEDVNGVVRSIPLIFQSALKDSALDTALLLACLNTESAARLPDGIYSWIDSESWLDWPHYLLGHSVALQNADRDNPEKVSLLTINYDNRLMTTGPSFQFWVKLQDLKNKHFDDVVPTSECD